MKVTVLLENTVENKNLQKSHGLSFYIKTKKHKLLIDTGSENIFIKNASKLGIDLSEVDTLIITHGHFDHGGGLKHFLELNSKAKIYIQKTAFEKHYIKLFKFLYVNIGLNQELINDRFVLLDNDYVIDNEIKIITKPKANYKTIDHNLYVKKNDLKVKDEFDHEQSVIVSENKTILFGGCGHRGIVNIVDDALLKFGKIDYVISGFHLLKANKKELDKLSNALRKYDFNFYTCHCTKMKNYFYLKQKLSSKIDYIKTGTTLEF